MTSAHPTEDVRIFHKECKSLAKAGYDVYLVVRGESHEKNGVHIIGVGQPTGGRLTRMTSFSRKVYKTALALNADVYHFHDPELLPYGLKLKKTGKKVIFDSHEFTEAQIAEKTWIPKLGRKLIGFLFSVYQKKICQRLDAIVTATSYVTEAFQRYHACVKTIGNYPILQEDPPAYDTPRKYVGFAGGINEQWNHDKVISAVSAIPDTKYLLCGTVEDQYLERLQTLPGWNDVEYLGKIPHHMVKEQYARCYAGVSILRPGANTGGNIGNMGNTKVFEQMMEGIPVICSDFLLWRDFIERYHCGICIAKISETEIEHAIRYLKSHPDEARRMGQNGRRAIKEEFNWEIEEKKLLALYNDLVGNPKQTEDNSD